MHFLWRRFVPMVILATLGLAACSGNSEAEDSEVAPNETDGGAASDAAAIDGSGSDAATVGDDAEQADPNGDKDSDGGPAPGLLVDAMEEDVDGFRAWTITYLSTGVDGDLVEVSGRVLAPIDGAENADIVAWAHGTTGIADMCAPSGAPQLITGAPQGLVQAGYVVVVTDYEGLGTEGSHPYLVGSSAANTTIDIVRAAAQLGVGKPDRFAVAGLSQGGHAALWTGQRVASYAPEVELVGVVAAAPAAEFDGLLSTIGTGAQGFAIMAVHGMSVAYDDVDLADYFTPQALDTMNVVENGCFGDVFIAFSNQDYDDLVQPGSWDGTTPTGALATRLSENSPGGAPIGAPVLFVQGQLDNIVPRLQTERLQTTYCSGGTNAELRLYLGRGHADAIDAAATETVEWLADRFAGVDPDDGCSTVDPDLLVLEDAENTPAAVEGDLHAEGRPDRYDTLVEATTAPRREACPGVGLFGGVEPSAFSGSTWVVEPAVGPRLDSYVARFESADAAATAFAAAEDGYRVCGSFFDPRTTAFGQLSVGGAPTLGQRSFSYAFNGNYGSVPVNQAGLVTLVDDTIYASSQTAFFEDARPDIAQEAVELLLR